MEEPHRDMMTASESQKTISHVTFNYAARSRIYHRVRIQSKRIDDGRRNNRVGQDRAPITKNIKTDYEASGYITLSINCYSRI